MKINTEEKSSLKPLIFVLVVFLLISNGITGYLLLAKETELEETKRILNNVREDNTKLNSKVTTLQLRVDLY